MQRRTRLSQRGRLLLPVRLGMPASGPDLRKENLRPTRRGAWRRLAKMGREGVVLVLGQGSPGRRRPLPPNPGLRREGASARLLPPTRVLDLHPSPAHTHLLGSARRPPAGH